MGWILCCVQMAMLRVQLHTWRVSWRWLRYQITIPDPSCSLLLSQKSVSSYQFLESATSSNLEPVIVFWRKPRTRVPAYDFDTYGWIQKEAKTPRNRSHFLNRPPVAISDCNRLCRDDLWPPFWGWAGLLVLQLRDHRLPLNIEIKRRDAEKSPAQ